MHTSHYIHTSKYQAPHTHRPTLTHIHHTPSVLLHSLLFIQLLHRCILGQVVAKRPLGGGQLIRWGPGASHFLTFGRIVTQSSAEVGTAA